MRVDFLNIPTEVVVSVIAIVLVTIGKYLLDLKKLKEVDGSVTETKTVAVGIEKKMDVQFQTHNDKMDVQFQTHNDKTDTQFHMQFDKLDNIDKYVAESRALKQAASGGGIDLSQTIAAIQAMATQMAELKSQVEQTAERENNLRQELAGVKEEFNEEKQKNQVLLRENRSLRAELNKSHRPQIKDRDTPER